MSQEQYKELMLKREHEILEAFKVHKTPTATARHLNNGVSRFVVMRIAMRNGLWTKTKKEELLQLKHSNRDMSRAAYKRTSKIYRDEYQFQDKIAKIMTDASISFEPEKQICEGLNARCDFFSHDFIIEAKVTIGHDELCRGFGQCMIYRGLYPLKRVAIVHPDDIEPKRKATVHIINNGISVLSESELLRWLC